MKYCEEYAALIGAWLDGELDQREATRLHIHLFSCPGCRAYLADMQALRRDFPNLEDVEVPEDFTRQVMDRVRTAATAPPPMPKRKGRLRFLSRHSAALACCMVILVLVGGHQAMLTWTARNIAAGQNAALSTAAESAPAAAPEEPMLYAADAAPAARGADTAEDMLEAASVTEEAAALPENAPAEAAVEDQAAPDYFVSISLTQAEAGDLLYLFEGKTTWEMRVVQVYYLTSNQYEYLLERLAEKNGDLPAETLGTADANYAKVIVTAD